MFNSSLKSKKPIVQAKKPESKVNEQESKEMLNQLLDEFDNNEDLVENAHALKAPVDVAFNK